MGEEYQSQWTDILPWVLLGRRTSYHEELKATPSQMLFGEDPPLPGELRPLHNSENLQQILEKAKANVNRPLPQTQLHRTAKQYMPPATQTAKQVYVKCAKPTPLGPRYDGPYNIVERLGDSALKLHTGNFVSGKPRTKVRHWNTCHPLDPSLQLPAASRPTLGRKKLNPAAKDFLPNDSESFTGRPKANNK